MLINLLSNAIKFSKRYEKVKVIVRTDRDSYQTRDHNVVIVEVIDKGVGISFED